MSNHKVYEFLHDMKNRRVIKGELQMMEVTRKSILITKFWHIDQDNNED